MPRPRTVDDEQILAAAAAAVGDVGPARLTLADVSTRVGLSPATLLQRFGSKRGLLLAVAARGVDAMPAAIRATADGEPVLERLVEALTGFASSLRRPAEYANHLSFLLMDLSDPDFQALSRQHVHGMVAALTEVLATARERGELHRSVDPADVAGLLHAVYNGALLGWGMAPDGEPAEAVRVRLLGVLELVRPSSLCAGAAR